MTKNVRWILIAAAALLAANLACISPGGTPTPVPPTAEPLATVEPIANPTEPPTVAPTEPPTETPPTAEPIGDTQSGSISLEVINQSDRDIWYVYVSPAKSDEWGEDRLGDSVILAGETYVLEGIPSGIYDIRMEDENGDPVEVAWETRLEGATSMTITGQAALEVVNGSGEVITYLYISPVDSESWGGDWLGDAVIDVGSSYTVHGVAPGAYDIQAVNADEETIEIAYDVGISDSRTWDVTGRTLLPSNAVLRFEDDFSDNRNDWGSTTGDEHVTWMPPSGGEFCTLIKSPDWTAWEWYEPFRTDEFVAEVYCTLEAVNDASCGIGFGPDADNLYWFEVSPYGQSFALFLLEDDTWQDMLVDWTESKAIDPEGGNFLSMERVGGVISVYINSVLVGQADGSRFPTGRIGIGGASYEDSDVTVCLDDLRVWRLE